MNWTDIYRSRVTSAAEAVNNIESGHRVWIHPGCCTPKPLVDAMVGQADRLRDVEVVHILGDGSLQTEDEVRERLGENQPSVLDVFGDGS